MSLAFEARAGDSGAVFSLVLPPTFRAFYPWKLFFFALRLPIPLPIAVPPLLVVPRI